MLSDGAAEIGAKGKLAYAQAEGVKVSLLDQKTPDIGDELLVDRTDALIQLRIAQGRQRDNEDTIPGYYEEKSEFVRIHGLLQKAEEVNLRRDPSKKIFPVSQIQNNPTALTEAQASALVSQKVADRFNNVRANILLKGTGSGGK